MILYSLELQLHRWRGLEYIDFILYTEEDRPHKSILVWLYIASVGEAPVQELWYVWNTLSLPLFPGPLWSGIVLLVHI